MRREGPKLQPGNWINILATSQFFKEGKVIRVLTKHKYDQGCRPFLLLPVKNGIGNVVHSSGKAWLAPDSIRGARSGPKPCSHLAITSAGIQKQLPLLETAQGKNTMHDKRVVGKQGPELALLLCFHPYHDPVPSVKGPPMITLPLAKSRSIKAACSVP